MKHIIVETFIWCSEHDANEALGLDPGDQWLPTTFDMAEVVMIKEASGNDFVGEGKAIFYLNGMGFTTKMDYPEAVKEFKLSRV